MLRGEIIRRVCKTVENVNTIRQKRTSRVLTGSKKESVDIKETFTNGEKL